MRVAVYDRWWLTCGGGEKFAGGIAQALSHLFDVDLIGHDPIDLDQLSEKLQLDLSRVGYRIVPPADAEVEEVSAGYDLFVNASYTSAARNRAAAGIYVVHFPTPPPGGVRGWRRWLASVADRHVTGGARVEAMAGLYDEETIGRSSVRWTTGEADFEVTSPTPVDSVVLAVARAIPPGVAPVRATVWVDDQPAWRFEVGARTSRWLPPVMHVRVPVRPPRTHVRVRVSSETFVPARDLGWPDDRTLGLPLVSPGVCVGSAPKVILQGWAPSLVTRPMSSGWLHTYTKMCANSAYTADWVRRWWKVPSEVLYPPVTQQPVGRKEPMILSVGRFFDPERGHSKKQLEMVRAFQTLIREGLDAWSLHLVGGCDRQDRVYLERVRHAIGEAPVHLHVAAPGAELRDLYSRAAIYWHAAGLGEDPDEHPERFEHFGITTVEAMSAGAVPVVIGAAGQAEVVRDGVDGIHFHTLDELVQATLRLVRDDGLRRRLSESARLRAADFSWEVFCENVQRHAEGALRTSGRASARATRAHTPG